MKYLALFPNNLKGLSMMPDEQAGKVFKAIVAYFNGQPINEYIADPMVFAFLATNNITEMIDRGKALFKDKEEKRTKKEEKERTTYKQQTTTSKQQKNDILNNNIKQQQKKENFIKEKKNDDGTQGNNGNGLPADNPMARARVLS